LSEMEHQFSNIRIVINDQDLAFESPEIVLIHEKAKGKHAFRL